VGPCPDNARHRNGHGQGHGQGHGGAAAGAERFYTAQVIWDETMAESAAAWLDAEEPRRIVIVAGNGHCHRRLPPHASADFVVELR
jgi:hypothetical protein